MSNHIIADDSYFTLNDDWVTVWNDKSGITPERAFGPQGTQVVRFITRLDGMSDDEVFSLMRYETQNSYGEAYPRAIEAARSEDNLLPSWRYVHDNIINDPTFGSRDAWDMASTAILALMVRDRISEGDFMALTAPVRAVGIMIPGKPVLV